MFVRSMRAVSRRLTGPICNTPFICGAKLSDTYIYICRKIVPAVQLGGLALLANNVCVRKFLKVHMLLNVFATESIWKTFRQRTETKEKEAHCLILSHIPGRVWPIVSLFRTRRRHWKVHSYKSPPYVMPKQLVYLHFNL